MDDHSRTRFRLYERLRKQEYRAEKRRERKLLEAQIYYLEDQIKHNIPGPARAVKEALLTPTSRGPRELARISLYERTTAEDERRRLQSLVQRRAKLARLLHAWVVQSVANPLGEKGAWCEGTLMADPAARQYGFEWLTDRVYHSAMRSQATDAADFDGNVADKCLLHVHTGQNLEVLAVENHCQLTLLVETAVATELLWTDSNVLKSIPGLELMDKNVHDRQIVFLRIHNTHYGVSCCKIIRRYDLPANQGTVFVYVYIRDDERYPLHESERRLHGYGWSIMHNIAPGVTLVRSSSLLYAPATAHGAMDSIPETAKMYGATAHATSNETTLARIEHNALAQFTMSMRVQVDTLVARVQEETAKQRVAGTGQSGIVEL
ncbi:Aste57867_16461 [Aphanomyces stellatus]|uniref:Aste57867_16461 protein n=1 Tax=Aphanomyces stellatus TaxID=120398 RepID=A0A485L724_9STRA|nr:hypothetical protein As57867_016404 [Aphanomyces stellatus]VFT93235.1 Aste57867_16461 [Aphanomyces stellatus]